MRNVVEAPDALTFLERARKFLFADESKNNLLVSSALILAKTGAFEEVRFFLVEDNDRKIVGAAIRSAQKRLIFSGDALSAQALQKSLSEKSVFIRGFYADDDSAKSFLDQARAVSGLDYKIGSHQFLMRVNKLIEPKSRQGIFRLSRASDLKTLLAWSRAFAIECKLDESPSEAEELVHRFHEMQQLYVWEIEQRPVAMAAFSGVPTRAARLSMVYTDPAKRGRGYAALVVHRLVRRLKQNSYSTCLLFADRTNRTAVGVYQKLGFEIIGNFTELRLQEVRDSKSAPKDSGPRAADASH